MAKNKVVAIAALNEFYKESWRMIFEALAIHSDMVSFNDEIDKLKDALPAINELTISLELESFNQIEIEVADENASIWETAQEVAENLYKGKFIDDKKYFLLKIAIVRFLSLRDTLDYFNGTISAEIFKKNNIAYIENINNAMTNLDKCIA